MVGLFGWVWSRVRDRSIESGSRRRVGLLPQRQESMRRGGGSMGFGWQGHRSGMSPLVHDVGAVRCVHTNSRQGGVLLGTAAIRVMGWVLGRSSSGFGC